MYFGEELEQEDRDEQRWEIEERLQDIALRKGRGLVQRVKNKSFDDMVLGFDVDSWAEVVTIYRMAAEGDFDLAYNLLVDFDTEDEFDLKGFDVDIEFGELLREWIDLCD